jgi:hypothetical protein
MRGKEKGMEKSLTDFPTVSIREAVALFNMGKKKFRRCYEQTWQFELNWVLTTSGVRLLLQDVIKAAYPGIPKHTLYTICYEYTMKQREWRKRYRGVATHKGKRPVADRET